MRKHHELYMNYRSELAQELWNTFFINIRNINQNIIRKCFEQKYSVDSTTEVLRKKYNLRDVHDILL
ncbi:MAG TPA: hypothetical protein QF753_02090 [Victivallales bacterium]|nr:hypothetical protein [Victivallales bacterium]